MWLHILSSTVSFVAGMYVGTKYDVIDLLSNIPRRQPIAQEPEKAAGEKKGWGFWPAKETKND
jgi:hypothetical protein